MLCDKKSLTSFYIDTKTQNLNFNWQKKKRFASYNELRNVLGCKIIVIMRRRKKEFNGYGTRFNAYLPNFALTETNIASVTVGLLNLVIC